MTALFLTLSLLGSAIVCWVLARRNRPSSVEQWKGFLAQDSARLLAALELQTAADRAMALDALRRAVKARDSRLFAESLRLVDMASGLLGAAVDDRTDRLRGMTLCLRMAGAVDHVGPLEASSLKVPETRGLVSAAGIGQSMLVSTVERLFLRIVLLRGAYRMTFRAFRQGHEGVKKSPGVVRAWTRCHDAVSDWTEVLDPAHVEAFRAILGGVRR